MAEAEFDAIVVGSSLIEKIMNIYLDDDKDYLLSEISKYVSKLKAAI